MLSVLLQPPQRHSSPTRGGFRTPQLVCPGPTGLALLVCARHGKCSVCRMVPPPDEPQLVPSCNPLLWLSGSGAKLIADTALLIAGSARPHVSSALN